MMGRDETAFYAGRTAVGGIGDVGWVVSSIFALNAARRFLNASCIDFEYVGRFASRRQSGRGNGRSGRPRRFLRRAQGTVQLLVS